MRTAAILPVKRFADAKQRLGTGVSDHLRRRLAAAMAADVLAVLGAVEAIECTLVVTREHGVAGEARATGATVLDDTAQAGQSAAVEIGIAHALQAGFERVLCVPGDCPAVEPAELHGLLAPGCWPPATGNGAATAAVTIVPDRHGTGTNGLLLAPANAIAPSFGPGSCQRHIELARAAGAVLRVERLPSLLLDIDTGEDLGVLRDRLTGSQDGAQRTRALLGGARANLASAASGG